MIRNVIAPVPLRRGPRHGSSVLDHAAICNDFAESRPRVCGVERDEPLFSGLERSLILVENGLDAEKASQGVKEPVRRPRSSVKTQSSAIFRKDKRTRC